MRIICEVNLQIYEVLLELKTFSNRVGVVLHQGVNRLLHGAECWSLPGHLLAREREQTLKKMCRVCKK